MTTIYDIAKKTGFSITTVSKVLNNYSGVNENTRKKIQEAVNELGYHPNSIAKSLTTKKSWLVGIIFQENLERGITHPFFSKVIESFKQKIELAGYDVVFLSGQIGSEKKSVLEHAKYRGVDAIIVVCTSFPDPEVNQLMGSDIPMVVLDIESNESSVVYSDNEMGSQLAVEYLHSLGHRRIAHIAGTFNTLSGKERLAGFQNAILKNGLEFYPGYVVNGGYYSLEGGYEAMKQLLALSTPPTAVYVGGDYMALGAYKAVKEKGLRIPEDISIMGFDDIELAPFVAPPLTTIRQNTDLLGEKAAELLIQQINNKEKLVTTVVVPVELVVRESCKAVE